MTISFNNELQQRAHKLGLVGLVENWHEFLDEMSVIKKFISLEENKRQDIFLRNRFKSAQLGNFRPIADFDWKWPKKIDREIVEDLFTLDFIKEHTNCILIGPNGAGKTMIAKNLAYKAILSGYKALVINAAITLNNLSGIADGIALERKLNHFSKPDVLVIDEVGYLSYANRHADLLFQLIERRYEKKSTIITTNKPFSQWNEIFHNAACATTLVDRVTHNSDIVCIEVDASYRYKETEETNKKKRAKRAKKNSKIIDDNL
jgi:DNA replication protein DnaC